jgi:hypothetical protein
MALPLTFSESQLLTAAAPSAATDGMAVGGLQGLMVTVETAVPASQTLSGAGTLQCYVYDSAFNAGAGAWSRLPQGDLTVSTSGVSRLAFQADEVLVGRNGSRIVWKANGVTVSAGTTVTVYQLGYDLARRGLLRGV